jgi:hypothetical protein
VENAVQARDYDRSVALDRCSVAKLPVEIVTPALDIVCGEQGARVVPTCVDLFHAAA